MAEHPPGHLKYPHLFEPRKIGQFTVPNSVKYAACSVSNFNHPDGSISDREMARMQTICSTGAGLITNQGAYPDAEGYGKAYLRQLSIAEDRFIPVSFANWDGSNGEVGSKHTLTAWYWLYLTPTPDPG